MAHVRRRRASRWGSPMKGQSPKIGKNPKDRTFERSLWAYAKHALESAIEWCDKKDSTWAIVQTKEALNLLQVLRNR